MQTTKQQIITLLKRTGGITIEEAAGALSLASMTARQHLAGLERDGLVKSEKVRRSNGRPHYLFTLTPKGEDLFPKRYDLLAQIFLDEVAALSPNDIDGLSPLDKQSLLILRTADRLADLYRLRTGIGSLEQRVSAATEVLQVIGGFAEYLPTDTGYEIRDYNCVFSRIVPETRSGCEWHIRLLNNLLHWPVQHEVITNGRQECCRYIVEPAATGALEGIATNA